MNGVHKSSRSIVSDKGRLWGYTRPLLAGKANFGREISFFFFWLLGDRIGEALRRNRKEDGVRNATVTTCCLIDELLGRAFQLGVLGAARR